MTLRNPVKPGSTQILATASIESWRLSWKRDHPLEGEPQTYLTLNGKGLLPLQLHQDLLAIPDTSVFLWHRDGLTEYTWDYLPDQAMTPPGNLYQIILNTITEHFKSNLPRS